MAAPQTPRRDPPERDIQRDPLSKQPGETAQPQPNRQPVTQVSTPQQRNETKRQVRHPNTGELITLEEGETKYDTQDEIEIDGIKLELNKLGKVQLVAQVRIDNIYQPSDRFAVDPDDAVRLLKQRTDQGFPVVALAPGPPEPPPATIARRRPSIARDGLPRGAPDRSFAESVGYQAPGAGQAGNLGASDVFTSGLNAMRLALRSTDRPVADDASPAEVTAAFNATFSQVVTGTSPPTPNTLSNQTAGSPTGTPPVGPGANPAGSAGVHVESSGEGDEGKGEDAKSATKRRS